MASTQAYKAAIARTQSAAARYVSAAISTYVADNDPDAEDLQTYAIEVLNQAVRTYGDQAAVIACQQYEATMQALGIDVDMAEMVTEAEATQATLSAYGANASSGTSALTKALQSAVADKVLHTANRTIATNADRDYSSGVRWARVPTGAETCGFCVMLASRGFVYTSAETAGYVGGLYNRYHNHCDCTAVAGTEGTTIEGYDPDWYYSVYKDARETLYGENATVPSTKETVNAICNEIGKRSKSWVYGQEAATVSLSEGASDAVTSVASILAGHGLAVSSPSSANASLDYTIGSRSYSLQAAETDEDVADALAASRLAREMSKTGAQSSGEASTVLVAGSGVTIDAVRSAMRSGEEVILVTSAESIRRITT